MLVLMHMSMYACMQVMYVMCVMCVMHVMYVCNTQYEDAYLHYAAMVQLSTPAAQLPASHSQNESENVSISTDEAASVVPAHDNANAASTHTRQIGRTGDL